MVKRKEDQLKKSIKKSIKKAGMRIWPEGKPKNVAKDIVMERRNKAPESYWNHRVMAHPPHEISVKLGDNDVYFNIHEVHYKNGRPTAYSVQPVTVGGDSLSDISWTLNKMKECLKEPILWHGDRFPEVYFENKQPKQFAKKEVEEIKKQAKENAKARKKN